jgi:hypothetical protein
VEPRFTNAPVHEQFGSRTNFPSKKHLVWRTVSRITNTQAGNSGKLRVSALECQWLVNLVSVYEHFGSQTASRNELSSWTEVPLYSLPDFCLYWVLCSSDRPLSCCDRGFESHRGHGCLSVVCCQVEVSATNWLLVQRSPTDCGASLCVITKPREWGGHRPRWASEPEKINNNNNRSRITPFPTLVTKSLATYDSAPIIQSTLYVCIN